MARRVLAFDWSATPLGPIEGWPRSLQAVTAICLHSPFQMAIHWGPDLTCIYNDAARDVLGDLHPAALGLAARDVLRDSWDVLEPQLAAVMEHGEATRCQDAPLRFDRRGTLGVGYFTYAYSPIPDDDGDVGGVLLVTQDTTAHVLTRRRADALRALGLGSLDAPTERDACTLAAAALDGRPDLPFTLLYLLARGGSMATLAATSELPAGSRAQPTEIELAGAADGAAATFRRLARRPSRGLVVGSQPFLGAAVAVPERAFATAISGGSADRVAGFLVVGLSDELAFDDAYRSFVEAVAIGVGRSVAAARARREERERTRAQERALHQDELQALVDELTAAQRRVAEAGDAERRRIERNLHDGAQQRLMAVRLDLGLLAEQPGGDPAVTRAELVRLRRELDEALEELRDLAHGLYPPLLASDGLPTALTAACRRAPVAVEIESADIGRLPAAVESAAYFCCLEAVQNVAKHGGADARVRIRLELGDGTLEFRVRNDGAGFHPGVASGGQGLANLRDRLTALGGHAEVASAPGRGTTVSGTIPLP